MPRELGIVFAWAAAGLMALALACLLAGTYLYVCTDGGAWEAAFALGAAYSLVGYGLDRLSEAVDPPWFDREFEWRKVKP